MNTQREMLKILNALIRIDVALDVIAGESPRIGITPLRTAVNRAKIERRALKDKLVKKGVMNDR